jgi:signal transduction histidine kinase
VAPLFDAGRALGFLVVARPLDDARNDLRQSGLAIAASALFYLVMITLCVYVAGEAYINRPVRRLMHAMRRFRMRGADTMAPAGPTPRGRHELETLELEYHHLQHALVEAEKKLGAAVVERRDLNAALQRADKLATLGQLAAALAHEVGSPLQVIQGRLHALLGHAHDAARTRREVGIALEQAERITRMVERLLGMTRGPRVEVASVNVVDAVQAVVDLLDHQIERRGVVFELDTSPDLPTAKFDPDPIQQIVLNLLTNALTATPPGHRVTVRLEPAETSHDQSAALRIVVEDAGCGMTEEQIEHAFDAFFTTHAEEGGTGLGLAVVRAITERRGGTVRICSRLGSGTEVVVELPWSNDDPTNASNAA